MVWDASKSPGDLITSSDWNDMVSDQKGHASRHEGGGTDEIGLGGLSASDDSNIGFGTGEDFQLRFDSGNNRLELFDNTGNQTDVFRVSPGGSFVLRNRNLDLSDNSLVSVDLVDGVDVSSHASRHSDGGGDELDAADLAGAAGTNGQVLQTDGSTASWSSRALGRSFNTGHTEWTDGLMDEEIGRINLQAGETLRVDRIEFRQKGGGSSSSVIIDVFDSTASSIIGSQTLGGVTKNPGSSGTGNLVLFRVENSSGGTVNASVVIHYSIEGA